MALTERGAIRSGEEIARRLLCLLVVSCKGLGMPSEYIDSVIDKQQIRPFFTLEEMRFVRDPQPSGTDMVHFGWAAEAAWPLLWSLGHVDSLGLPEECISLDEVAFVLEEHDVESLMHLASRRSEAEILDEADLTLRCYWAVRQAQIADGPLPDVLSPDVVFERHKAFMWLVGRHDWEGAARAA
jgi:hypothetical protein